MDIKGKTAIVTGSSAGVGRETALQLARRGANVVINYSRGEDDARAALADVEAAGAKALLVHTDVSNDAEVREMVRQTLDAFGGVDILINNAATTYFVPFHDLEGMTEEMWDRILAVNLKGAFFCCRAVAKLMQEGVGGCIVNVGSIAGVKSIGSSIAYAASKAGVINMTIGLARALAPKVRVNCVAPGFIDTRWLRQGLGPAFEPMKQRTASQTPLGRVATSADVAQAILGFVEADFVTGQTLIVDGGANL